MRGGRGYPTAALSFSTSYPAMQPTAESASTAPVHKLSREDARWLHWCIISLCTLMALAALLVTGVLTTLNELHTELLQGMPFYLSAQGASQGSVLSPIAAFACCIPLTLYGTVVLSLEPSARMQWAMTALALVALALPGLLCTLWDSVLHTAPLLCCILIVQLLVSLNRLIFKRVS